MGSIPEKEWMRVLKQEERFLQKAETKQGGTSQEWFRKLEEKIPPKLSETLHEAFYRAFLLLFEKGADVIGKTFSEEEMALEFQVNDFRMNQKASKKAIRKLEQAGKQSKLLHSCVTTAEGIGFGILGIGIPDIPVFLGILLKGMYETAISYGFAYREESEQILILRMITAALAEGNAVRERNAAVEEWMALLQTQTEAERATLVKREQREQEIRRASAALAEAMLTMKFLQGIPVVGAIGGMSNPVIYRKILQYTSFKYKKRYLTSKMQCA